MEQAVHIRRSCSQKRHYATRSAAKRAKRVMAQIKRQVFSIYHCSYCGCWHLTHNKRRYE